MNRTVLCTLPCKHAWGYWHYEAEAVDRGGGPPVTTPAPNVNAAYPAFATMDRWKDLTGMSRRKTYDEIARGNLRAIKSGKRTLVDVQHGLAFMRSLPLAEFKVMERPKQAVTA